MPNPIASVFKKGSREFKPPFTLKAYNAQTGEWEEIDSFNEPKKLSELKDIIEEYKEDGYTRFRLEDAKGQKVWVRYYKTAEDAIRKNAMSVVSQVQQLTEVVNQLVDTISKLRGDSKLDPNEILASNIAFIQTIQNLCKQAPWICGVSPSEDKDFMILQMLLQMFTGARGAQIQLPAPQVQMPAIQQTAVQQEVPKINPNVLVSPSEDAVKVVNSAVAKALEETAKIWKTECQVLGACVEGEQE
jgi:nitrogen regulatory protein PII